MALRPRRTLSSMKSRYGSQALACGARTGLGGGAESVDTSMAGFEVSIYGRSWVSTEVLGYSDKQFVRLALQDLLEKEGVRMKVVIEAA